MKLKLASILAVALLCLVPTASLADLATYNQDFEALVQADPDALANDGWLVFGNVFTPGGGFIFGYGPFPAPNGGAGFSAIDAGQGGPAQGLQQLSIYNDYNNFAIFDEIGFGTLEDEIAGGDIDLPAAKVHSP